MNCTWSLLLRPTSEDLNDGELRRGDVHATGFTERAGHVAWVVRKRLTADSGHAILSAVLHRDVHEPLCKTKKE